MLSHFNLNFRFQSQHFRGQSYFYILSSDVSGRPIAIPAHVVVCQSDKCPERRQANGQAYGRRRCVGAVRRIWSTCTCRLNARAYGSLGLNRHLRGILPW